jgi:hypothetical protein
MFKKLLVLCSVLLLMTSIVYAKEIGSVTMPDTLTAGSDTLSLNGTGVRSKFFIKAYVCGLYLKKKSGDANAIINADEPMALRINIISKYISSDMMEEITREGFHNSTNGNTAPFKDKIDMFVTVFSDNIRNKDVYDLIYTPAEGLKVYKNKVLKTTTKDLEFKKVLFGIWLGNKPADGSLKNAMLSGK